MEEPTPVIPLEYSRSEEPKPPTKWLVFWIGWQWIVVFIAYFLIFVLDIESVLVTGPAISLFAIILLILSAFKSYWLGVGLAVSYLFLCGLLFSLVNLFHWSPMTAYMPFVIIGGIFLFLSLIVSVIAIALLIPRLARPVA